MGVWYIRELAQVRFSVQSGEWLSPLLLRQWSDAEARRKEQGLPGAFASVCVS